MPKLTRTVNPDWLTKQQAADLLQVSVRTINHYMTTGVIDVAKHVRRPTSRTTRIAAAAIEKILS